MIARDRFTTSLKIVERVNSPLAEWSLIGNDLTRGSR